MRWPPRRVALGRSAERVASAAVRNRDQEVHSAGEGTHWQAEYCQHRPMVERAIAWLTRGNRKVRYHGVTNNDHWLHHRAAALNLRRLITLALEHTGTTWAIT